MKIYINSWVTMLRLFRDTRIQCDGEFHPVRGEVDAAGIDIYNNGDTVSSLNGFTTDVETLTAFHIPKGYFGMVVVRSGLGFKGLTLINGVGIIDSKYRDYIGLRFINTGSEELVIERGDRVAQIIIIKYKRRFKIVELIKKTGRGGFGSTGKR